MSNNNIRMIDLLINNSNMDDFLISNGKIKKFCPLGFFNNGANDKVKNVMEDMKNGRD